MTQHEENQNLVQIFLSRVQRFKSRQALLFKESETGKFCPISWDQWAQRVKHAALGLYGLGVRAGDRVAILSENCPEWSIADLGILSLGAVTVPIYPTSSCPDVAYLLQNAGVRVLFVSTDVQCERIQSVIRENAVIGHVICLEEPRRGFEKTLPFKKLEDHGRLFDFNNPGFYDQLVAQGQPDDLATLIYTSGTTGPPKGVMLTHRNFISNYLGATERIKITDQDIALSFLPLSHVFERLAGYYFMAFHGATIAYAENMQSVPEDIRIVRPTIAAAVPRFYEKVHAKILENVQAASPLQQKIFNWALGLGRRHAHQVQEKRVPSLAFKAAYGLAKILVFNKIKRKLGGRLKFFISGGAPLSKELAEFFFAAGILILEGYGLTETSPVIAVNAENDFCFGTVGRPLPNVEVKIAGDGEILTRGPCVMKGYYNNPEATSQALEGGWFHTGDIGEFTPQGFLKITDRKKDIIATSGGKKVSPQNIEGLVTSDKLFSQMVVLGDKRNYLVALLVPARAAVEAYARQQQIVSPSYEALLQHPKVQAGIEERFRALTKDLAPYEQIKHYALLAQELSQEAGELTPTLKVKRKVVMEKYKDLIESLYQKGAVSSDTG